MKTPDRVAVALHLRDLETKIFPMAKAAGIEPPQLELRHIDGLTRAEAKALYEWGLRVPGLVKALGNQAHADHGAIAAFRDLVNYFQFDHPQIADKPAPWGGDLSPAMAGFLFGTRDKIDVAELTPEEAAGVLAYSETQPAYQAAAADGTAPQHAAISAEIEALNARAAEVLTSAEEPAVPSSQPAAAPEQNMAQPQPADRIAEINRLLRDTKMSAPDRRILVDELADLLEGHPPGQPLPPPAPLPGTGTPQEVVVTAPRGSGLTEKSIALTEELRQMKYHGSAERQAKLGELARNPGRCRADRRALITSTAWGGG